MCSGTEPSLSFRVRFEACLDLPCKLFVIKLLRAERLYYLIDDASYIKPLQGLVLLTRSQGGATLNLGFGI